ncbi:hypothetical protein CHARACLAT_028252 [Characodon lateralis]|uniref:Uncharacterized protein n=1 Tax=Characodon lateralis TaxID=208331 RepID=A0ABU7EXG1_9TELE|nr:hypothetical protein [Characodon lateralis]
MVSVSCVCDNPPIVRLALRAFGFPVWILRALQYRAIFSLSPDLCNSTTSLLLLQTTLQPNFSFIFLSLLTGSMSAVNSASSFLNSVSPGGSCHPLLERPDSCHFPVGF